MAIERSSERTGWEDSGEFISSFFLALDFSEFSLLTVFDTVNVQSSKFYL